MTAPAASLRPLTPSEIVYLRAEEFAREATFTDGIGLLHTDRKVRASDLSRALLAVAVLEAERQGTLRLAPIRASRLFGLRKVDALGATPADPGAFPEGTLEARVRKALREGPTELELVLYEALGEDDTEPRGIASRHALEGLAQAGWVEVVETRRLKVFRTQSYRLPDATRALIQATPPEATHELLARGKADPARWELLQKAIDKAVSRRKEAADGPD